MKKLFAATLILAATFASINTASASDIYVKGYPGWAQQALDAGDN